MKVGKSYWMLSIRNESARNSMHYKEYQQICREIRQEVAKVLGNKFEFSTEKEAELAKKKLPAHTLKWVKVAESFPVSLGLGWC